MSLLAKPARALTTLSRRCCSTGSLRRMALVMGLGAVAAVPADKMNRTPRSLSELSETVPRHEWVLHDGKHWQIVSSSSETPAAIDAREGTRGGCPAGMVEVRGRMKIDPTPSFLEAMQDTVCLRWISEDFPARCALFDRERWLAILAPPSTVEMSFCIDRYEYPNAEGQYPWVFVTWTEATALCAADAKRLCTETEWTFACEGEEAWPYPNGYVRSPDACVIDHAWQGYNEEDFVDRASLAAMLDLDRAWEGEPSGSRAACRSVFGVYDMTGNVDEWTTSASSTGFPSILKGGYWGPVRNRCRASTRAHGPDFAFYQQGFRCCADAK